MSQDMVKRFNSVITRLDEASKQSIVDAIHLFKIMVLQYSSDDETTQDLLENPDLINAIIEMCLIDLLPAIHKFLRLPAPTAKSDNDANKTIDPIKCRKWPKLVGPIKVYLTHLLKLLDAISQSALLTKLLRHILYLIPFYLGFTNLTKNLLKKTLLYWSEGEEKNRVLSFLIISRLMRQQESEMINFIMKKLFVAYIKSSKKVSKNTWPMIIFMQQSLVEFYSLDQGVAYQHAFIFIRQCAINLKNASLSKKKEDCQKVYNWPYVQSLLLWSRLLSNLYPSDVLKPLIHPLVQVTIGTIKLIPSMRSYPLQFHLIKSLIKLSNSTNTFIPVLPFLNEMLDSLDYSKKLKNNKMQDAKLDLDCILKISKKSVNDMAYINTCVQKIYELFLEHLANQSHCIAFPELVFQSTLKIRKFVKQCTVASHAKRMQQLLAKIEENSSYIEKTRKTVSFAVSDTVAINEWQRMRKEEGTCLTKYYNCWQQSMTNQDEAVNSEEKKRVSGPARKKRKIKHN